ncbi:hypothetical protein Hypma_002500 [Hypsizygus marmoreus]|uniref:Uncharacterized protein n=1 Tax=Hypsizygus marmoreus TaxID=39966 RepID=A0A369JAW7_HYPMA|nr:hypothetical protein Hypma_002500 [Hypsizygus marmoreus]
MDMKERRLVPMEDRGAIKSALTHNNPIPHSFEAIVRQLIADVEKSVAQLDDELALLQARAASIQEQRTSYLAKIQEYQTTIAPHRKLPVEMLGEVFSACCPEPLHVPFQRDRTPWTLTRVCRQWRQVAFSTTGLWSHVMLDTLYFFSKGIHTTKTLFSWNDTSLVSLHATVYPTAKEGEIQEFDQFLVWCAARMESLSISGLLSNTKAFMSLPADLVPNLRQVKLIGTGRAESTSPTTLSVLRDAPRLDNVTVSHMSLRVSLLDIPFAQLTRLSIAETDLSSAQAWDVLCRCTGLVECILQFTVDDDTQPDSLIRTKRHRLPELKTLRLSVKGTMVGPFWLPFLALPSLVDFQISASSWTATWQSLWTPAITHSGCLGILDLDILVSSPDLEQILAATPALWKLRVPRGMAISDAILRPMAYGSLIPKLISLECKLDVRQELFAHLDMLEARAGGINGVPLISDVQFVRLCPIFLKNFREFAFILLLCYRPNPHSPLFHPQLGDLESETLFREALHITYSSESSSFIMKASLSSEDRAAIEVATTNNELLSDSTRTVVQLLIADATQSIIDIDYEIPRRQALLTDLQNKRIDYIARIQEYQTITAPHRKLPFDILKEIFIRCCPKYIFVPWKIKMAPWSLIRVCSKWRQVALATPALWSNIQVARRFLENRPSACIRMLEYLVNSSVNFPISLDTLVRGDLWPSNGSSDNGEVEFTEFLCSCAIRLQHLSGSFPSLRRFMGLPSTVVENLQSLGLTSVDGAGGPNKYSALRSACNLRSITFTHGLPPVGSLPNIPFSQLTNLTILGVSSPSDLVLDILSRCWSLVKFSLGFTGSTLVEDHPRHTLPALKRLQLFLYDTMTESDLAWMTYLCLPALVEYRIALPALESYPRWTSRWTPIITYSGNLESLILDILISKEDLAKFLVATPSLQKLEVPRGAVLPKALLRRMSQGVLVPNLSRLTCKFNSGKSLNSHLQMLQNRLEYDPGHRLSIPWDTSASSQDLHHPRWR